MSAPADSSSDGSAAAASPALASLAGTVAPAAAAAAEEVAELKAAVKKLEAKLEAAEKATPADKAEIRSLRDAITAKEQRLVQAQRASAAGTSLARTHTRYSHGAPRSPLHARSLHSGPPAASFFSAAALCYSLPAPAIDQLTQQLASLATVVTEQQKMITSVVTEQQKVIKRVFLQPPVEIRSFNSSEHFQAISYRTLGELFLQTYRHFGIDVTRLCCCEAKSMRRLVRLRQQCDQLGDFSSRTKHDPCLKNKRL